MMESLGKAIVGLGTILVVVGLLLWFAANRSQGIPMPGVGWFGHLPGDIRIERPGFSCFFPITTMLIVSIVLSVVLSLLSKFFR